MVHPMGFLMSWWDSNCAPLGFCELGVEPQWFTLGVLLIRGGTPMVHPWGFLMSRWNPNGAPLEFCEFLVGPQWCTLGVL